MWIWECISSVLAHDIYKPLVQIAFVLVAYVYKYGNRNEQKC